MEKSNKILSNNDIQTLINLVTMAKVMADISQSQEAKSRLRGLTYRLQRLQQAENAA